MLKNKKMIINHITFNPDASRFLMLVRNFPDSGEKHKTAIITANRDGSEMFLLSEPIKDFVENIGDKFITTHFSDYDFKNERHWLPGEGDIDWVELMETLEKVGYCGPILYELGLMPPATETLSRRKLTFSDFKENHTSLINKEKPKAIGTVNPEKCIHWKDL